MNDGQAASPARREGRILLIRHGQTAWNGHRYAGWGDIPLDEVGRRHSQEIASLLAQERIDSIYCSSLRRAVDTIRPLAEKRELEIRTTDDLRELHYGEWQGSLKSDLDLRVQEHHQYLPLPGGESLFDVYQRVKRFTEGLPDLVSGSHLAIVGHFWSNRMLLGAIRRLPFGDILGQLDYTPRNGSVLEIRYVVSSQAGVPVLAPVGWPAKTTGKRSALGGIPDRHPGGPGSESGAGAGVQNPPSRWIPASAGMTTMDEACSPQSAGLNDCGNSMAP